MAASSRHWLAGHAADIPGHCLSAARCDSWQARGTAGPGQRRKRVAIVPAGPAWPIAVSSAPWSGPRGAPGPEVSPVIRQSDQPVTLFRAARAGQAHRSGQRGEPPAAAPPALRAGVRDTAHDGERVSALVQHHLEHGPTARGQPFAGAGESGSPGRAGAAACPASPPGQPSPSSVRAAIDQSAGRFAAGDTLRVSYRHPPGQSATRPARE